MRFHPPSAAYNCFCSVMPQISRLRQSASADVSPLSKLCELRQLNLVGFGLADVSPLSSLQQLSRLEAGLNPLSGDSLRVLGRLPALAHLELGGISQVGRSVAQRVRVLFWAPTLASSWERQSCYSASFGRLHAA
jgi:hypothetical protein